MIFSATKAVLRCVDKEVLTSGMQQAVKCVFSFSHDWDDLGKTAVFICGDVHKDMVISDGQVIIPHEVLTDANVGKVLRVGVYGIDGSGNVAIPTIMCSAGEVLPGADPFEDHGADPTPTIWEQMLADNAETRRVAADERAATEEARDVTLAAKEETETARDEAKGARAGAEDAQTAAKNSENEAKASENNAKSSENASKLSEQNANKAMLAVQNMDVEASTLQPESPATVQKRVDPETGEVSLAFGIPQGAKGDSYVLTAADKLEIAGIVLNELPTWTGGNY